MPICVPFTRSDLDNADISPRLRGALLLAYSDNADLPKTITVDGFEYVVDEDEISTVWQDDPSSTSAIYVRPDLTRWSKWADTDGRDSFSADLIYTGERDIDLAQLVLFNAQITD